MTKKFTPIDYLNKNEQTLLREVKVKIKNAKTVDEIKYYNIILDLLLEKSVENFNKEQEQTNKQDHLQHV